MPCLWVFLCSLAVFAVDAFEAGSREEAEAALLQDDLCDADAETCSLKLLQLRGYKEGSQKQETYNDEDGGYSRMKWRCPLKGEIWGSKCVCNDRNIDWGGDNDMGRETCHRIAKRASKSGSKCEWNQGSIKYLIERKQCVCDRRQGYIYSDKSKKCVKRKAGLLQGDVEDEEAK
eukprot:TRINITY_DN79032_c0_g1_i1.p1 TRINITY_DN79032_c0_g1~~TRINITY_DN79032_c0_g1_i1.p1  ORF type:complete len:175 (+),score=31.74 TRINITY_DN79032_c0_g1_i1:129-653(+)